MPRVVLMLKNGLIKLESDKFRNEVCAEEDSGKREYSNSPRHIPIY